jgi:hypothetical protein
MRQHAKMRRKNDIETLPTQKQYRSYQHIIAFNNQNMEDFGPRGGSQCCCLVCVRTNEIAVVR